MPLNISLFVQLLWGFPKRFFLLGRTLASKLGFRPNTEAQALASHTFYLEDFTEQEKGNLKTQLQLFELDVPRHPDLKNLLTLSELCQGLVRVGK